MSLPRVGQNQGDEERGRTAPLGPTGWLLLAACLLGALLVAVVIFRFGVPSSSEDAIRPLVESEELMLALTPKLEQFAKGIRHHQFPDHRSDALFADQAAVVDLAFDEPQLTDAARSLGAEVYDWPIDPNPHRLGAEDGDVACMWLPLLQAVDDFAEAKFFFIRGQFPDLQRQEFHSDIGFQGRAKTRQGTWIDVRARQSVVWRESVGGPQEEASWKIVAWKLTNLQTTEAQDLLFSERLAEALPGATDLERARESIHEKYITRLLRDGSTDLPYAIEPDALQRGSTPACRSSISMAMVWTTSTSPCAGERTFFFTTVVMARSRRPPSGWDWPSTDRSPAPCSRISTTTVTRTRCWAGT